MIRRKVSLNRRTKTVVRAKKGKRSFMVWDENLNL